MNETERRKKHWEQRKLKITCVVPVHNEQELIETFSQRLEETLQQLTDHYQVIFVNDGSQDQSLEKLKQLSTGKAAFSWLSFSRNFGKENAIAAGLAHAQGDVTIILDADFQHPLKYIPIFIKHWLEGFDNVYGVRTSREDETWLKRSFSKAFYSMLERITEIPIPPNAGDFRLLDKKVVAALNQCQERARFMKGLYAWVGFSSLAVPFEVADRPAGKSSWHFGRLTNLAITGFTAFSDIPLRIWGMIGAVVSVFSFLSIIYIIFDVFLNGTHVPGYATLLVSIIFFGGIQLFSIGVLGEYISRIFSEVKKRPPYLISEAKLPNHPFADQPE
jgi:glycosyltransferase involved in cell wall biosynthesis